jgi:hypothetical protein
VRQKGFASTGRAQRGPWLEKAKLFSAADEMESKDTLQASEPLIKERPSATVFKPFPPTTMASTITSRQRMAETMYPNKKVQMINRITPDLCSNAPGTDLLSLPELNETPAELSPKKEISRSNRQPMKTETKNQRYSKNEDFGDYLDDSADF